MDTMDSGDESEDETMSKKMLEKMRDSEVSYFIPDPRNFYKATRLPYGIKKPCIKSNMKGIKI